MAASAMTEQKTLEPMPDVNLPRPTPESSTTDLNPKRRTQRRMKNYKSQSVFRQNPSQIKMDRNAIEQEVSKTS
jgi:hypothetical protein